MDTLSMNATWRVVLWLSLVAVICEGRLFATTVFPTLETCPICQGQFISSTIGSWFQCGEADRDFAGSLSAASIQVVTCPHCLFSALQSKFDSLSVEEKEAVRKALAKLSLLVRPLPERLQRDCHRGSHYFGLRLLGYRIADVCDAALRPDLDRTAALRHSAYLVSKVANDASLLAEERWRAIEASEAAAKSLSVSTLKRVTWTYLAGELRRCSGDTNGATARLEEAAELARRLDSRGEAETLGKWAREQTAKAREGDTNDMSSTRMAMAKTEERRSTLRRDLPDMLAALRAGKPPTDWLLKGDARKETISLVEDLAREGDQEAVSFLFRWLARLEHSELSDREYVVCEAARIVAQQADKIEDDTLSAVPFRFQPFGEVMRYAVADGTLPPSIERRLSLANTVDVIDQAAVSAAIGRGDAHLKPLLLVRMKRSKDTSVADLVKDYFSAIGGLGDIPALEAFAAKFGKKRKGEWDWTAFSRKDVEDAIRLIRMREAFAQNH